jgi:hypothetical protein
MTIDTKKMLETLNEFVSDNVLKKYGASIRADTINPQNKGILFKEFFILFKDVLLTNLRDLGINKIDIRQQFYYVSGFIKFNNGKVVYLITDDLRINDFKNINIKLVDSIGDYINTNQYIGSELKNIHADIKQLINK